MKKFILATAAAMIATFGHTHVAEAGWRHHNRHFGHFNLVIDAGPRYVVDDYGYEGGDCYVEKSKHYNRYGELVIRKVRICD